MVGDRGISAVARADTRVVIADLNAFSQEPHALIIDPVRSLYSSWLSS